MAAGLGFKTFNTGDVLSAADTNGYLMQGVLVFADSAARASAITSPQEGQFSFLKDTNSTEYYTGSAWAAVGGGGGGGGKVLQVVSATYSTSTTTTSTSYSDTGLTATITPSAATSKVLVLVSTAMGIEGYSGGDYIGFLQLVRTSTALTSVQERTQYAGHGSMSAAFTYLDSPATTSATTYKTQIKSNNANTYTTAANDSQVCSIVLLEIGA